MNRNSAFAAIFVILFGLATCLFAHPAFAAADEATLNNQVTQCKKTVQNNTTKAAQDETAAAHNVFTGVPAIDSRLYSCVENIRNMFNLNATLSNPLSLLGNILISQIMQMVNQLCSMATATLNSIKQSALSLLNVACVPLPSLGLSGPHLTLPTLPCNGTNLLNPQITTSPSSGASSGRWTIFNH